MRREVAFGDQSRVGVGHDVPEPVEPVRRRGLVEGAGDVRDPGPPQVDEMPYGRPGTAPVVAVDVHGVAGAVAPAGLTTEHGGHARAPDQIGQRVVEVQGEDEGAVDMSTGEISADTGVVVAAFGEQQYELGVVGGQFLADAPELEGEEGVGEDPGLRFGDDDGDGVVPSRHQGAGGLVGHVAEFLDGLSDSFDEGFAHTVPAVHDA